MKRVFLLLCSIILKAYKLTKKCTYTHMHVTAKKVGSVYAYFLFSFLHDVAQRVPVSFFFPFSRCCLCNGLPSRQTY